MSTVIQRNFSGGEVSENIYGRSDSKVYANGLKTCRNFVVFKQGGVRARQGTTFISSEGSKSILVPFVYSNRLAYVLVFRENLIRVYKDDVLVHTVTTTYPQSVLDELRFSHRNNRIVITHRDYKPRVLTRVSDTDWNISDYRFTPEISRPTNLSLPANTPDDNNVVRYQVTAIMEDTYEESLVGVSLRDNYTVSAISWPADSLDDVVLTIDSGETLENDFFRVGETIIVKLVNTETYVEGKIKSFTLNGSNVETITLSRESFDVDIPLGNQGYGGSALQPNYVGVNARDPFIEGNPNIELAWDNVEGAIQYNVYKEVNGVFGFIGIVQKERFIDTGQPITESDTAPIERNPFFGSNNYPSVSEYNNQRLFFANTNNNVEIIESSRVGQYNNFTFSSPITDDSSLSLTAEGSRTNDIQSLVGLNNILAFTSSGVLSLNGNNNLLSPFNVNISQHSYHGSSSLRPLLVGHRAIYEQVTGGVVRDIGFNESVNGYSGNDISIYASHLLEGHSIVSWDYQESPDYIVWIVRSDGVLLGITYLPEQEMIAWHKHDVSGLVESVCVIPNGMNRELYLSVNRDGNRMIEKLSNNRYDDIEEYIGVDSSYTYNGTQTTRIRVQRSGQKYTIEGVDTGNTIGHYDFVSSDIGKRVNVFSTETYIYEIESVSSSNVATCIPIGTVSSLDDYQINDWSFSVNELSNLNHLEGKKVSVVANGFVISNPNDSKYKEITVSSGSITLDNHYDLIHVGLPITCDIETLQVEASQGTVLNRNKNIQHATIKVVDSGILYVKTGEPPETDSVSDLLPIKFFDRESASSKTPLLYSGDYSVTTKSIWGQNGNIFIRKSDPLPSTILSIALEGKFS